MEKSTMDKSLLFITLSCVCVWLIVDSAIGNKYLYNFLGIIFPFMSDGNTAARGEMTTEEVEQAVENAPSSSTIGSGKKNTSGAKKDTNEAGINSVPYGASRQG